MPLPTVVGFGATNSAQTPAVTYALAAGYQTDDILLCFIAGGATIGVAVATSGWAHVPGSPRAQGTNVLSLSVHWKRATSSSETDPVGSAAANHQVGFTTAIRGVKNTGNPWNFNPVIDSNLTPAAINTALGTTTAADCLELVLLASGADAASDQFSAHAAASLANLTLQKQGGTALGNGSSVNFYTGEKAAAGSMGNFSATHSSNLQWALIALALEGAPAVAGFEGWGVPL